MTGKRCFLFLLQVIWFTDGTLAQRSPYSLQAAVDELHHREAAKYPLNAPPSQQHFLGSSFGAGEQDYWDDDTDFPTYNHNNNNNNNNKNRNRHRINKALAKYLERENYDADHDAFGLSLGPFGDYEFDEESDNKNNPLLNYLNEKKRSSAYFRERDNKYDNAPSSIFRERESQVLNAPDRSELTEEFLHEIEEAQEREREERYKDALRHLWEKYQQQENEIEGDLLDEKKRVRTPPYYMLMQKKRSYPVLPWLPYEKKKRFPVAKRSTKRSTSDMGTFGKTDEKVARELSELFGTPIGGEEKRKRSAELSEKVSTTHAPAATSTALSDMHLEGTTSKRDNATTESAPTAATAVEQHQHGTHAGHHGGHALKQHKHRKRSEHSHESSEEGEEEDEDEEEHDEHDEHEEEDEEEIKSFEYEEEAEERKKKRDVRMAAKRSGNTLETAAYSNQQPANARRKKSIQWSKYFGIDRKKKAMKLDDVGMTKRSANADDNESDNIEEDKKKKKKRDLDPEKLANMDKKLQSIEDFIIDETIKYTGSHEGITKPEEIRRLKDHVLSRLATAYSLEKMRRALDRLRQSVDNENHLTRNVIEAETRSDENDSLENQKRLSVKKEKANLLENERLFGSNEKPHDTTSNANKNADSDEEDDDNNNSKKKKKRTNSYLRYPELPNDLSDFEEELGAGHYETLNDAYLGNKNYIIGSNQCPLIETMADRCRGVDLLSGDINQELLPICGVHQICYLCGTSQVACDYQYLAEADTICGNNNECQIAARSVLMILRGTPSVQVGPRECLKNPCLYSAMREIGL